MESILKIETLVGGVNLKTQNIAPDLTDVIHVIKFLSGEQ